MSIIQFPNSMNNISRRNNEETPDTVKSILWNLLIKTPNNVNEIINKQYSSPEELVVINTTEFKALIIDYIIFHLHRNKILLEEWVIFWIQYISDLLFKIFLFQWEEVKLIVEHPYYTHWMEQWYPKRAGDASVYSYMFRSFKNKPTTREDYVPFATNAYMEYSKDKAFANWIWNMLPIIWDMLKDGNFLKRWHLRKIK